MSELADLVGAVRLPSGSHRRTAGTDAVIDLLVLRRRTRRRARHGPGWESTRPVDVDGEQVRINAWLAERPEMILGHLAAGRGMYASDTLLVRSDVPLEQLAERLQHAAGTLVAAAREHGLTAAARDTSRPALPARSATCRASTALREAVALAPPGEWDGHIVARADGSVRDRRPGRAGAPVGPRNPGARASVAARAARPRAGAAGGRGGQLEDTPELAALRDGLRGAYSAYVDAATGR